MPTVYRAQCLSCGGSPQTRNGVAGFVSMDGKGNDGKILPEGYVALELDDGQIACLPHPIESSTLSKHGYTWTQATRAGKLLRIQYKICTDCGTLCEEAQTTIATAGCIYSLIPAPAIFLVMILPLHSSWIAALLCSYLGMITISLITSGYTRIRWRKKNVALKISNCRSCKGKNFISIPKAVRKPVMCPHCHTPNMKFTIAGKS